MVYAADERVQRRIRLLLYPRHCKQNFPGIRLRLRAVFFFWELLVSWVGALLHELALVD